MRALVLRLLIALSSALSSLVPSVAQAQCRLCATPASDGATDGATDDRATLARPLAIEVEAALDMGKVASRGSGGSIAIDERTGARRVEGLIDLGGFAIKGSALLTGEPLAHVRVAMPGSVRMTAPDGSTADAVDLRTDLPLDARLGADGTLRFGFGGRLVVPADLAGNFRGRITITADYE